MVRYRPPTAAYPPAALLFLALLWASPLARAGDGPAASRADGDLTTAVTFPADGADLAKGPLSCTAQISNTGASTVTATVRLILGKPSGEAEAFNETFETGAAGWQALTESGPDHWSLQGTVVHAGAWAWAYAPPDGSVTGPTRSVLHSPTTPVPEGLGATLRFWHRPQFSEGGVYGVVQVSCDQGGTWEPLLFVHGGRPEWTEAEIDLTAFMGESVWIGFAFVSTVNASGPFGWAVDDLTIASIQGIVLNEKTPQVTLPPGGSQGVCLNHTLASSGSYLFVAKAAYPGDPTRGDAVAMVRFTVSNLPPVAVIASPADGGRFLPTEPLLFSAVGSEDPDGVIDSFRWESSLEGTLSYDAEFERSLGLGDHEITLTVRDPEGAESVASVTVHVVETLNRPPVAVIASPSENATFRAEDTVVLDGRGSYDPDGDPLTFLWRSNRTGELGSEDYLAANLPSGFHRIDLVVADDGGASATASVCIKVLGSALHPPVLSGGRVDPPVGDTRTIFTFAVSYSDLDGDPGEVWLMIDGSPVAMQEGPGSPPNGSLFTCEMLLAEGDHSFRFRATDGVHTIETLEIRGPSVGPAPTIDSNPSGSKLEYVHVVVSHLGDGHVNVTEGGTPPEPPEGCAVLCEVYVFARYDEWYWMNVSIGLDHLDPGEANLSTAGVWLWDGGFQPVPTGVSGSVVWANLTSDGRLVVLARVDRSEAQGNPPELLYGRVTPTEGGYRDRFVFTVVYADADGDAAEYVRVVIGSRQFPMQPVSDPDTPPNPRVGVEYQAVLLGSDILIGERPVRFEASDGEHPVHRECPDTVRVSPPDEPDEPAVPEGPAHPSWAPYALAIGLLLAVIVLAVVIVPRRVRWEPDEKVPTPQEIMQRRLRKYHQKKDMATGPVSFHRRRVRAGRKGRYAPAKTPTRGSARTSADRSRSKPAFVAHLEAKRAEDDLLRQWAREQRGDEGGVPPEPSEGLEEGAAQPGPDLSAAQPGTLGAAAALERPPSRQTGATAPASSTAASTSAQGGSGQRSDGAHGLAEAAHRVGEGGRGVPRGGSPPRGAGQGADRTQKPSFGQRRGTAAAAGRTGKQVPPNRRPDSTSQGAQPRPARTGPATPPTQGAGPRQAGFPPTPGPTGPPRETRPAAPVQTLPGAGLPARAAIAPTQAAPGRPATEPSPAGNQGPEPAPGPTDPRPAERGSKPAPGRAPAPHKRKRPVPDRPRPGEDDAGQSLSGEAPAGSNEPEPTTTSGAPEPPPPFVARPGLFPYANAMDEAEAALLSSYVRGAVDEDEDDEDEADDLDDEA